MSDTDKKMAPAYVPFDTLDGFVAKLKKTTVPHHIHKTLMPNLSGAIQGHLLAALKFLGLTDEKGDAQQSLHELVEAHGTPTWKPTLANLLEKAYKPIIGDLNIKTAIPKTLQDRFKDGSSAEGETVEKCIRFYLKALTAADVEISPYLKVRSGRKPGSGAGKARPRVASPEMKLDDNGDAAKVDTDQGADPGMMCIPLYIPGKPTGKIEIHKDLVEADVDMIAAILMAYAKRRGSKEASV